MNTALIAKAPAVCVVQSAAMVMWNVPAMTMNAWIVIPAKAAGLTRRIEMSELKITKEKVLEAASKCATAKATLEVLFPEIFGERLSKSDIERFIDVRNDGEYSGRAFFIDDVDHNWALVKDSEGALCLVPSEKDDDIPF